MHGEFTGNNLQVQLLHVGLIDPFPSLSKVISLKKKKKQQQLFPPAAAHSYRGQSSCGFITPPPGYSQLKIRIYIDHVVRNMALSKDFSFPLKESNWIKSNTESG